MRAARMQIYSALMRELDSEGAHYSQDISEVDLADPEDAKVVAADPGGAVLIHLGSSDFLRRYKIYLAHLQEWRQQFQKLDSVDLRYERQIIVNPDSTLRAAAHPAPAPAPKAPAAPKPVAAAKAAAVAKPAAATTATPAPATVPTRTPARTRKPSARTAKTSSGTQPAHAN